MIDYLASQTSNGAFSPEKLSRDPVGTRGRHRLRGSGPLHETGIADEMRGATSGGTVGGTVGGRSGGRSGGRGRARIEGRNVIAPPSALSAESSPRSGPWREGVLAYRGVLVGVRERGKTPTIRGGGRVRIETETDVLRGIWGGGLPGPRRI